MGKIFEFGQKIDEYDFKVINERDARASAGIMFLLGTITLAQFLMTRNIFWANLFTITFIFEFFVRIFINPRFAPYMVLGSLIVSNQEPDWVEASPKKFAWILGVILGAIMTYFIVFNIMTPFRLLTCLLCLALLYMEAVFGICLGCIIYKQLNVKLYKCPGGVCEMPQKKKSFGSKFGLVFLYIVIFYGLFYGLKIYKYDGYTSSLITQEQKDAMEFENDMDNEDDEDSEISKKDCNPPLLPTLLGQEKRWIEKNCN